MAAHSSILAWEIPWTEEPDGLWSMGSQRVGHDCTEHIYITSSEDGILDNNGYHSECLQEDRLCAKRETIKMPQICIKPLKLHKNTGRKILELNKAQRL